MMHFYHLADTCRMVGQSMDGGLSMSALCGRDIWYRNLTQKPEEVECLICKRRLMAAAAKEAAS